MNKKQISNLKENLKKYSLEMVNENNKDIQDTILILIEDIEKQLECTPQKRSEKVSDIIELIEKNDIDKLNQQYPAIKYNEITEIMNSEKIFNSIGDYTIIQLKIVYFLLTNDKSNNAIKTKKKSIVFDAVSEAILEIKRSSKFKNI